MSEAGSWKARFLRAMEHYARAISHRARLLQEAEHMRNAGHILPSRLSGSILRSPASVEKYVEMGRFIDPRRPLTLVDVGGHDGTWSSRFLRFFPDTRIIAFEPTPAALAYQARYSRKRDVTVVQAAVGADPGEASITLAGALSSLHRYRKESYLARGRLTAVDLRVPVVTLDGQPELFSKDGRFVVLKIDTQGHEVPVLKGATQFLSVVDLVSVEVTIAREYEDVEPSMGEVVSLLRSHGLFAVRFSEIGQITSPYAVEQDVLFVRDCLVDRLHGW